MLVNETLNTIKKRRSIRSFRDEQIKEAELEAILEAGIYAPSAGNQQAWHFTVVQDTELLFQLNQEAKEVGKQIEDEHIKKMVSHENFSVFHRAPTAIFVSGKEKAMLIETDTAAATQNLLLAAESIGLGSCWVNLAILAFSSPRAERYLQKLRIPEGYKPFNCVVLGYKKVEATNAPPRKPDLVNYIQ